MVGSLRLTLMYTHIIVEILLPGSLLSPLQLLSQSRLYSAAISEGYTGVV